jgi:hypothetical protein
MNAYWTGLKSGSLFVTARDGEGELPPLLLPSNVAPHEMQGRLQPLWEGPFTCFVFYSTEVQLVFVFMTLLFPWNEVKM